MIKNIELPLLADIMNDETQFEDGVVTEILVGWIKTHRPLELSNIVGKKTAIGNFNNPNRFIRQLIELGYLEHPAGTKDAYLLVYTEKAQTLLEFYSL
jgi:hypothetical protein